MICSVCGKDFTRSEKEKELAKKLSVRESDYCADCGLQNIMAFWPSIGKWYKRKCDFSGETIITNYPNSSDFPVYKSHYFESDDWERKSLGIDFKSPFFPQLKSLQSLIPRPHMLGINNENCDYCDDAWSCKSCYLSISMLECENLFYSYRNIRCNNSSDLVFCFDSDQCYHLVNSTNCFKIKYGLNVDSSSDSMFLYDCRNVRNCFMCWNLRSKEYCILNKQYSREEYEKKLSEINLGSRKEMKKLEKHFLEQIQEKALHRANMNTACENVTGNFVVHSKNCENVSLYQETENTINAIRGYKDNDCMFVVGLLDSDLCYNIGQSSYLYNVKYSSYCTRCRESEYLDNCLDCHHCFGCVGLKGREYCILNKQYSREEYETNVQKIRQKMIESGEYGKFFPYNMAYSGYNTTVARFYYPETKEHIAKLGGFWEDDEGENIKTEGYDLPDDIQNIPDDIASKTIMCDVTGKPFNYIPQVIEFHKKHSIPLSNTSHIERLSNMYFPLTFIKPYTGICCLTGQEITHYYGDELKYKNIASNEAYDKEING